MKTKIFALISAICCLSVMLVACKNESCTTHVDANSDLVCDSCGAAVEATKETDADTAPATKPENDPVTEPESETETVTEPVTETETVPVCEEHRDQDGDKICDVCGRNVIVIYQPVEPEKETRVDMEIVTAPTNANISDFINVGNNNEPVTSMDDDEIKYDHELIPGIGWVEEAITETETVYVPVDPAEPEGETTVETESKVVGTQYDVIDTATGDKIIDSIVIDKLDFELPAPGADFVTFDAVNDSTYPFAVYGNTISATNVAANAGDSTYDNTTSTYTLYITKTGALTLDYDIHTERSWDKLIIDHNGAEWNTASGEDVTGSWTIDVYEGDTITIKYEKDISNSSVGEKCEVTITSGSENIEHGVYEDSYDYFFVVNSAVYTKETKTVEEVEETTYYVTMKRAAYTYAGDLIAEATWTGVYDEELYQFVSEDETSFEDLWLFGGYDPHSNVEYAYFIYDGTVYVIDKKTHALTVGGSSNTFIERPEFNYLTDAFGYVRDGSVIYAYDATKWLDCVYSYTIPGYFEDTEVFVLANGNLLVQGTVVLNDNAVSYDFYNYGTKYDIVYIIVDPTAKTATEIEFGYKIDQAVESELFTEKAANVFLVYAIENDMVNYSKPIIFAVDNTMNILCELPDMVGLVATPFGNGYLYVENVALNCYEIYNAAGEHVTYVPGDASFYGNYVELEDDYYTIAGTEIQALNTFLNEKLEGEYEISAAYSSHIIVRETVQIPAEEEGGVPATDTVYHLVTVTDEGFAISAIGNDSKTAPETFYEHTNFGYITYTTVYKVDDAGEIVTDEVTHNAVVEKAYFTVYNRVGVAICTTEEDGISYDNCYYFNYNSYGEDGYKIEFRFWDEDTNRHTKTYIIK